MSKLKIQLAGALSSSAVLVQSCI